MPSTDLIISRIQNWVRTCGRTNLALAAEIGVDEKSVRQAASEGWNPRAATLRKFEAALPADWGQDHPRPRRKAAA